MFSGMGTKEFCSMVESLPSIQGALGSHHHCKNQVLSSVIPALRNRQEGQEFEVIFGAGCGSTLL